MIYLDHAASTSLRPCARAAIESVWDLGPGNPTGAHTRAQALRACLETGREELASLFCAPGDALDALLSAVSPGQIIFTSGGTEADNTAILTGAARGIVLVSAAEHPAVLVPAIAAGAELIPVDTQGRVDLDAFSMLLRRCAGLGKTAVGLVSVMAANNETGVIQPLAEIGALVAELAPGAIFHSDAVQGFGKMPLDMAAMRLDALSLSGHKIGGPFGIGALVWCPALGPVPLLRGGGQERERRAGTPDAASAAAFGKAARASAQEDWARVGVLRDRLEAGLQREIADLVVHGAGANRLPTHTCVGVPGMAADLAVIACDRAGLAVSAGSSCASGAHHESPVMRAMGVPPDMGSLRFSLGWDTRAEAVEKALDVAVDVVRRVRRSKSSPRLSSGAVTAQPSAPSSVPKSVPTPGNLSADAVGDVL